MFLLLFASSAYATISFDNPARVDYYIYYNSWLGTYTNRNYYGGDLFQNDANVNDCMYFGTYVSNQADAAQPFHDLNVGVQTPVTADIFILDWQYHKDAVWTTIPALQDDSNGFQIITGTAAYLTFPYPEKFRGSSGTINYASAINGYRASWIRGCITDVSNITEGGRMDNVFFAYVKDYAIRVENDISVTAAEIYLASEAGDWNAVEHYDGTAIYYFKTSLKLANSDFYSTRELLQFGNDTNIMGVISDSASTWNYGYIDAQSHGHDGSCAYYGTGVTNGYSYHFNMKVYASMIIRKNGGFNMMTQGGYPDWRDSIFNSDATLYAPSQVLAGSNFIDSYYDSDYYFYIYTPNLALTNLRMTATADGLLMGTGSPVARGVNFLPAQYINRYYAALVTCVNCTGLDPITEIKTSSPNGTKDVWVDLNATLDITVRDDNGSTSQYANVYITDNFGRVVADVNTNSDGQTGEMMLQWHRAEWKVAEAWATRYDYAYNPYRIKITKPGQYPYEGDFNITTPTEWQIKMGELPIIVNGSLILRKGIESLIFVK